MLHQQYVDIHHYNINYTCNKAAGPDGIPPRLLNETVYKIMLLLTFIDLSVFTPRQIPLRLKSSTNHGILQINK